MEIRFLTVEDVLGLHEDSIRLYGGGTGVRDHGLLESAVLSIQQTFGGEFLYPTLFAMAAAIWHGVVANHPFVDGNKRTGLRAGHTLLLINGWNLTLSSDEVEELTLQIAKGELTRDQLAEVIESHIEPLSHNLN